MRARWRPAAITAAVAVTLLAGFGAAARGASPGPVAYWKFDEEGKAESVLVFRSSPVAADARTLVVQSGQASQQVVEPEVARATDSSPNGNHARVDGVTLAPGVRGSALAFHGSGALEAPDSPTLRISNALTVEFWVWPEDFQQGSILSKDFKYAGPAWFQIYFYAGDPHLQVAANHDDGPTVKSRTVFQTGRWYHVAASYDGKSRTRIYVNGALDCEDQTTYRGPLPVGGESLKIGRRPDGCFFRGALDEFRLFAAELTPEEIAASYRASRPEEAAEGNRPIFGVDRRDAAPGGPARLPEPIAADGGLPADCRIDTLSDEPARQTLQVTWPQIDRRLPVGAKNLALVTEGARFLASSTAGKIDLGTEPDRNARLATIKVRWQDSSPGGYPDWLAVRFPQPHAIDTVVVRTLGEHMRGRNREGIRDWQVQCRTPSGNWSTVASVKNNVKEYIIHRFPTTTTDEVRLFVTAGHRYEDIGWAQMDLSRLQDLEVYQLGSVDAFASRSESRTVTLEKSSKGRIAIFKDQVPVPGGIGSSPDYLAGLLRQAGYGVTFLDADLLAETPLLSKERFDLFVHPYGCSFPLGTTLYPFLESGGHLLAVGGQAFTNALVRAPDGRLAASGYDPGIITTPGTMVHLDWYSPLREQLGLFAGANQTFAYAASARAVAGQHVVDPALRVDGLLEGYPATGLVGQVVPLEEEAQYVREGKELPYIYAARAGTKEIGSMHRLAADHNYFMFNKPCARWLPLVEAEDRFGRPRGSAGAMILNHDGLYRGSIWTLFGVTNRDLFARGDAAWGKALLGVVDYSMRAAFLHGLRPGYSCYRQGENVTARVFAANFGPAKSAARVRFLFLPLDEEKTVHQVERTVELAKGQSTLVEVTWDPPHFDLDFYRIRCLLEIDGRVTDQMESGLVVWNEESQGGRSAFHANYRDNYFYDGDRPRFILGTRTDGLHRVGQHGEDPLAWERQFQMMQDFGMSAASPVFFQMYVPGFAWGKPLAELVPEELLRQLDAQVQLSQRHKLIYAPCLFFENRHDCLTKEGIELSARIARMLGDRYCRVPGLVFYIWDDGTSFDGLSAERFLELSRRCAAEFAANPAGRRHLMLAEIYSSQNLGTRRIQDHLTIGHHQFRRCSEMVPARIADLRVAGRSQGCGEFYYWAPRYGDEAAHRFYLDFPHLYFGLGYSWILNWQWWDDDASIFPWGIVFPCDRIPKAPLYSYRNLGWFFRSFRPKYEQPELILVLPNAYWEKNRPVEGRQNTTLGDGAPPAEIDGQLLAHLGTLMSRGHVNLGIVDESDLGKLAPTTRALVYPVPMCPAEATYAWLRDFVRSGGHLYLTGDFSYEPAEQQRRPERLKELAGVEPVAPLTQTSVPTVLGQAGRETTIQPTAPYGDWREPYQGRVGLSLRAAGAKVLATDDNGNATLVRHAVGKGEVVFNADLTANAPGALLDAFLREAKVNRVGAEPDHPETVRVFRVPMENGAAYGVTSLGGPQTVALVDLPMPVTLQITRSPMVVAGVDAQGRLTACESDGLVKVGDRAVVEATASFMLFTLDGKPIEESEAVVLLPQPESSADVVVRPGAGIDLLEIGDVESGAWHLRDQKPVSRVAGGIAFHLDAEQSLGVVLLCRRTDRDRQVERLRGFLQGYAE